MARLTIPVLQYRGGNYSQSPRIHQIGCGPVCTAGILRKCHVDPNDVTDTV